MRSFCSALLGLLMAGPASAETVRFSLLAPEARSVELAGEMTQWAAASAR